MSASERFTNDKWAPPRLFPVNSSLTITVISELVMGQLSWCYWSTVTTDRLFSWWKCQSQIHVLTPDVGDYTSSKHQFVRAILSLCK